MADPQRRSWLAWLTLLIAGLALGIAIAAYREAKETTHILQNQLLRLQDRWEQYLAQGEERLRLLEALLQQRSKTAPPTDQD